VAHAAPHDEQIQLGALLGSPMKRLLGPGSEPGEHLPGGEALARRAARLRFAADAGTVPKEDADLAQLDVERERALAGDPSGYATTRVEVLAESAERRKELIATGRLAEGEAAMAHITLEKRFPPLGTEPPAGK